MAINFPTSLDVFTDPTASDQLNLPSHSGQHTDLNNAVEALEAKVGADGSAVTTSHDYKIAQLEARTSGKILQVVSTTKTDTFTTTSSTYTAVTGLTAAITPSSASSKVLVIVQLTASTAFNSSHFRLSGGNTSNYVGAAASNRIQDVTNLYADASNRIDRSQNSISMIYLDSPATTSSTTYGVEVRIGATGGVYINQSNIDSDSADFGRGASSITVMEVAA